MNRVLAVIFLILSMAGCQTQNPFAAFGSARVPPPMAQGLSAGTTAAVPSRTTTNPGAEASTALPSGNSPSAGSRAATAGGSSAVAAVPQSTFTPDRADQEPIRIVENPPAAARTASSATRSGASGGSSAPATTPASGPSPVAPQSPSPAPKSGYLPAGGPPANSRVRGSVSDQSVAPAAYQRVVPAFTETSGAGEGQWRAR